MDAKQLIAELPEKIQYHNCGAESIGGADARTNIIGNVVGFLPVQVRLGGLTKKDAKRVVEAFNLEMKKLQMDGISWDELNGENSCSVEKERP